MKKTSAEAVAPAQAEAASTWASSSPGDGAPSAVRHVVEGASEPKADPPTPPARAIAHAIAKA